MHKGYGLLFALLVGMALGAFAHSRLGGPQIAAEVAPLPQVVREDGAQQAPTTGLSGGSQPTTEVRYVRVPVEVKAECVSDTVTTYVPIPSGLAPNTPVVASDDGVRVIRPRFSDPTISFTYYDPADQRVETRIYDVPQNPLRYAVSAEAFVPVLGGPLSPGLAIEGLTGYGRMAAFVRGEITSPTEYNARIGLRWTVGRR